MVALALGLAAINQIFSLLDPWIFRHVIDEYVTAPASVKQKLGAAGFMKGAGMLILAAMGVAMVSRIAKNFQDYYVNVITQRLGAKIYSDGLAHSLELPYSVFEDQRSGETLGILQKVRTDTEKLITAFVNILFTSIIGITFVFFYAINIHWLIAVFYISVIPVLEMLGLLWISRSKWLKRIIFLKTKVLQG